MAAITIRNLDDAVKRDLQLQAARHGRSMEEEARALIRAGIKHQYGEPGNLATAIRSLVEPFGGVELDIPLRTPTREPPTFN